MMQPLIVNDTYRKERKAMMMIYASLLVLLSIDGLLSGVVISTAIRSVQLLALMLIFYNEFKLWRMGRLQLSQGSSKFLLVCLFALLIGIIVRGNWDISGHYLFLKLLSFGGFLPYVLPFLIVPLPNSYHIDIIKKIFFIGALFSFPLWAMNAGQLVQDDYRGEGVGAYLPYFAAFLLGFPFVSKHQRIVCFIIWVTYLLLMILNARRNMVFSLSCLGLIAYYCCNFSCFIQNRGRTISLSIIAIVFVGLFVISNIDVLADKVFTRFSERFEVDSRSEVEELFLADFASSSDEDWIWGRGLDGGYYQEMHDVDTGEINTNRKGIETGYLNNILKGGYFIPSLSFLLCLPALSGL